MPVERYTARFEGRVQGVGFRATTRSIAVQSGVTGWVRNEPDGSVQLEAQGPPQSVRGFLETLRSRMGGFIRHEHVEPMSPLEGERGFEIRR